MSIFTSFNVNASGNDSAALPHGYHFREHGDMNTTRTDGGTPYRRKVVTFEEKGPKQGTFSSIFGTASDRYKNQGVKVSSVKEDNWTQMNMVYDPSHPDADENGYVTYPNVNVVTEMTNLIDASRSYEANATAFNASKSMAARGLEIAQS